MSPLIKKLNITVDKLNLEQVCFGLLQHLLFQRTLGNFTPKEISILDIPLPVIDLKSIEDLCYKYTLDLLKTSTDRGVISLVLCENQSKKVNHWFSFSEVETVEQVPWEMWIINFNIVVGKNDNRRRPFLNYIYVVLISLLKTNK